MTITGGPVFWILLILAVASVVVFFERLFELRRSQIDWQDFIKGLVNILEGGNDDEALAICEDTSVPVANIVATAIRNKRVPARALKESVDAQQRTETNRLERRLASLSIMSQIAPMLGLLGAIIGLIKTVMMANSDALVSRSDLLNASMESLVSAALGLAIAIPLTVMAGSLRIRMDRIITDMDAAATHILGYIAQKRESSK
ncbi:MAG: MotA/TolQ/ExbB proton channel family protein [Kiritimatiellae bacterium]|nr:MotA/TolQ/ExbB proton channel family protein [Kiritimatiellia bacterium]